MVRSFEGRMTVLLKLLCLILAMIACFFLFDFASGAIALAGTAPGVKTIPFMINSVLVGLLAVIPLLVFVKLVRAVVLTKEFFSRAQSKRMLLIAICLLLRVVVDLLAPRIVVPGLLDGAVGSTALGPSLNFMTLASSIMFFALAGVFEYGRKLQEDSDNIL